MVHDRLVGVFGARVVRAAHGDLAALTGRRDVFLRGLRAQAVVIVHVDIQAGPEHHAVDGVPEVERGLRWSRMLFRPLVKGRAIEETLRLRR